MSEGPVQPSKWRRALPLIASALAILIGVLLIVQPSFVPPAAATPQPALQGGMTNRMPQVGETIPDFELPTLDGRTVRLSELRGSPVVINFWATWCGPCKQEMPLLVEQYNWNKGKGLRVLAIDTLANDNIDDMRDYAKKFNMNFDVLVDEKDAVAGGWNVMGLPTTFFIKPDGTVAKVHVGQLTPDQLKENMKLILPN
jgi:cytochrome c biogenesis protein CcmG, thiol:disulfide interchange protein DsbE